MTQEQEWWHKNKNNDARTKTMMQEQEPWCKSNNDDARTWTMTQEQELIMQKQEQNSDEIMIK